MDIYTQWRTSLRLKQKRRTYQHFDKSLDLDNEHDFALTKQSIENLATHQFLPFLKFTKKDIRYRKDAAGIPHRSIKPRPIMYASHLDAHIYGFFSYIWGQAYERFIAANGSAESVIAYRKIPDIGSRNKGNIQFAQEVFQYIQKHEDCVAIVADISKFFDTLKHKALKERLCAVLGVTKLSAKEYKVFRSLTAFRFVSKEKELNGEYARLVSRITRQIQKGKSLPQAVYELGKEIIKSNKTEVGIPQGSPVSGLLANIYLSAFDSAIRTKFPDTLYRRYSDDIIIVCPTDVADAVLTALKSEIEKYALNINSKKAFFAKFERQTDGGVMCTDVMDGDGNPIGRKYVDYLGFEFDGHAVLLRDKTLQRSYKKADKKIRKYQLRQTDGYKHKPHTARRQKRNGSYMGNADSAMLSIGSNIVSQKEKFDKFIRRSRRNSRRVDKEKGDRHS